MAKDPYVIDPALQAAIDEQQAEADTALAAGLNDGEARTHWVGLKIEALMALMEYLSK